MRTLLSLVVGNGVSFEYFSSSIQIKLMIKHYLAFLSVVLFPFGLTAQSPCTTTNATGCVCAVPGQTNCDLLPDITISKWAVLNHNGGPDEYSQTGNGADDGRLRLAGSTPNIGKGSFTVGAVQMWTCGQDTYTTFPGNCPNNDPPKQLIKQKIYHKNGNNMSHWERWAGSMTYHPTHNHMHVDDWGIFTLRVSNGSTDTLNWPILGTGAKIGFCLMDFGTCSFYNGHCRDSSNNIMLNGNFDNWGLGGGNYSCSPVEQGISVGYTDIYDKYLDGMWIDIPPGTCNGDYWIVIEIDPNNNFIESDETNNWCAVPFTLTKQSPAGNTVATIHTNGPTQLCDGSNVTLSADAGSSYIWSNGDSTQSITVSQAGNYAVTVTNSCGTLTGSQVVTVLPAVQAPTAQGDTVCAYDNATLTANGTGILYWYDAMLGGNLVNTGPVFTTPSLTQSRDYFVESGVTAAGTPYNIGPVDNTFGNGGNHSSSSRYLTFDADQDFILKSVLVYAQGAGPRVIELRDYTGFVLETTSVNLVDGVQRVNLNFNITAQTSLRLGTGNAADMYRNNSGTSYPYSVQGVATITGSSAGTTFYYYFYDWEIETPSTECVSPRVRVPADILPITPVTLTGLNAIYTNADPLVTLSGTPAGGVFSGPGVSGSTFDPAQAGVGGPYIISYTFTDANGCDNVASQSVTVNSSVSVLDAVDGAVRPRIYPNPNSGTFTLQFELGQAHDLSLKVLDLNGRALRVDHWRAFAGDFRKEFHLGDVPPGAYFLELKVDERSFFEKVIVQ